LRLQESAPQFCARSQAQYGQPPGAPTAGKGDRSQRLFGGLVLALLVCFWPACGSQSDIALRLIGSNTIGSDLAPALVEGYLRKIGATKIQIRRNTPATDETLVEGVLPGKSSAYRILVKAHGSDTAVPALEKGDCDIAMLSRRIKTDEVQTLAKFGDMRAHGAENVIAMDGIAIIVNKANPVRQLSIGQISDIFTGQIKNWLPVGGKDGPINAYSLDDKSGTFDTFVDLVLGKNTGLMQKLGATAKQRFEDSKMLSNAVAGDPNGIGFVALPYVLSAVSVAVYDTGTQPVRPQRDSIRRREYLLYRQLYFYLPQTSSNEMAKALVAFALSDDGQDIVRKVGFISQSISPRTITPDDAKPTPEAKQQTSDVPQRLGEIRKRAKEFPTRFYFETGSEGLDNKSLDDLDRVVQYLKGQGTKEVILIGFADRRGSDQACLALSEKRARTVEREFKKAGISPTVRFFGKAAPIDSRDTLNALEKNRRVEIYYQE
jgi:phosphate transport system substrate-binding protein